MAPSNDGHHRSDREAAKNERKKRRTKCLLYVVLFAVFQTGIIALFALTIAKLRTPSFRLRSAVIRNFIAGTPGNLSFNLTLNAELGVKNTNFGRYRYRETSVAFFYRGARVGEASVHGGRAKWRSTRKVDVAAADLRLPAGAAVLGSELGGDLRAGVLTITSQARMRGRVELLFVLKRHRATYMNCSMEIVTASQQLRNIVCV